MSTSITSFVKGVAAGVPLCPTRLIREKLIETLREFCEKSCLWSERLATFALTANTGEYTLTTKYKYGEAMTLNTTLSGAAETTVDVGSGGIPSDAPSTGTLIITLDSGSTKTVAYTAHDSDDGFTIAATDFSSDNATSGNQVVITIASYGDLNRCEHVIVNSLDLDPTSERYLDENERNWRTYTEAQPRRFFTGRNRKLNLVYTPSLAFTTSNGAQVWVSLRPSRSAASFEDFLYDDHRLCIEWGTLALLMEIPNVPWADPKGALYYRGKFENELADAIEAKRAGYSDYQSSYRFTADSRHW